MTALVESPEPAEIFHIAPWERQPGETPRQYACFCAYRDLGPKRTMRVAAQRFYGMPAEAEVKRGKLNWFQRLSMDHHWVRRAQAWDAEKDRVTRQAQLDDWKAMNQRHVEMGQVLQSRGVARLKTVQPDDLDEKEARHYIVSGIKAERQARGAAVQDPAAGQTETPAQVTVNFWGDIDARVAAVVAAVAERLPGPASVPGGGTQGSVPADSLREISLAEFLDQGAAHGEAGSLPQGI